MKSFVWQPILILLPVCVLTGMGLFSLRQDKRLAEQEARERAAAEATRLARADGKELTLRGERSIPQFFPLAPAPPPWLREMSPAQRGLWHVVETAEFVSSNLDAERISIEKFIASKPPAGALADAQFNLLLLDVRAMKPWEGLVALENSPWACSPELTEAGLPVGQLICYRALRSLPDHAGLPEKLLSDIASDIASQASILSPRLIMEAERVCGSGQAGTAQRLAQLKAWWDSGENARVILRELEDRHPAGAWPSHLFWFQASVGNFLLAASPGGSNDIALLIFPEEAVFKALDAAAQAEASMPPYAAGAVEIGGKVLVCSGQHFHFATNEISWPVLAEAEGTVADPPPNTNAYPFRCRIFLADSQILYARQHQRTLLFGGFIVASLLAALLGLAATRQALARQRELSDLKSNFVASVSHELRAPIASMRLMAESLQRGKISDATKQHEYYGLLVQESRRLSMLIENILDYSRIERGSRQYEFEEANLAALAAETVQLMRPCAAQRQVELDLRTPDAAGAGAAACDGLALQQALINLLDNAIKHSAPGSRVAVGLENGGGALKLWVEDNGPGIPPSEHEKIFERFYRRGSELRRETQGIGIGLTIVKHIVEAHGGRVTVRSAPGQGSRFTMELPRT